MKPIGKMLRNVLMVPVFIGLSVMALPYQQRTLNITRHADAGNRRVKVLTVGISKYQYIPSVRYADKDACLFHNYMISPTGGNASPSDARLLLNEEATASRIFNALDTLLETSGEQQTLFIYFSGLADIDMNSFTQSAFLLAHDCPKTGYLSGGTLQLNILKQYLEAIAGSNGNQVFFITDAGSMAGSDHSAGAALQDNWTGVTKILSAGPGETAYEGKQYHGGGGVFTHYLIKGMCGKADGNADGMVSLAEIFAYLSNNVPKETNNKQNPVVIGQLTSLIAKADTSLIQPLFEKCR
jgi:hypothetical protein